MFTKTCLQQCCIRMLIYDADKQCWKIIPKNNVDTQSFKIRFTGKVEKVQKIYINNVLRQSLQAMSIKIWTLLLRFSFIPVSQNFSNPVHMCI